ncbi:hypothetical protein EV715DRAFT_261339 [Schizophyllum commune]
MPHGQDVPNYTSQGRCAQSTPPSSAQRRPTLAPVTEVPSECQYYHNMSLVVSPHPGAENHTTAAPAQSRRPAIVDAWSNPKHVLRHRNRREFQCTEAGCFEHFNTKGDRDSHLKKIHGRTGAQRAH